MTLIEMLIVLAIIS
ncbi:prepilin-type N-terminal cleavage/methylation domain-containing protein, partial [Lactococcus lactis]